MGLNHWIVKWPGLCGFRDYKGNITFTMQGTSGWSYDIFWMLWNGAEGSTLSLPCALLVDASERRLHASSHANHFFISWTEDYMLVEPAMIVWSYNSRPLIQPFFCFDHARSLMHTSSTPYLFRGLIPVSADPNWSLRRSSTTKQSETERGQKYRGKSQSSLMNELISSRKTRKEIFTK